MRGPPKQQEGATARNHGRPAAASQKVSPNRPVLAPRAAAPIQKGITKDEVLELINTVVAQRAPKKREEKLAKKLRKREDTLKLIRLAIG